MEAFWVWVLSLSTVSLICKYNVIPGSKHAFPFVKALPIIFLIRHMIDHSPAELLNKPIPELLSAPTIFFLQILVGLVLGLIGDLCLLKENVKNWFLVGLVSFLIGHIVYSYGLWSAASGKLYVEVEWIAILGVWSLVYGWTIARYMPKAKKVFCFRLLYSLPQQPPYHYYCTVLSIYSIPKERSSFDLPSVFCIYNYIIYLHLIRQITFWLVRFIWQ